MTKKYSYLFLVKILGTILITSLLLVGVIKAKAQSAPFAANKYYKVHIGETIPIDPTQGNFDPDGDPLSIFSINNTPINPGQQQTIDYVYFGQIQGTINKSATEQYTYTAVREFGFNIGFLLLDSSGAQANGLLQFENTDQIPFAANKYYKVHIGETIPIDPTQGNFDPDGDPLSIFSINNTPINPGQQQTIDYVYFGQIQGTINKSATEQYTYTAVREFGFNIGFLLLDSSGAQANGLLQFENTNQIPFAANKYYKVHIGETIPIDPTQGNFDPDGDPLSIFSINNTPINPGQQQTIDYVYFGQIQGTINKSATEQYTYTAVRGFGFNIGFLLLDSSGAQANGLLQFENTADQNTPNAINDVYTTSKNLPTVVNPILNDSDPDGDPISITSIQNIALTPGTAQTINVTNGVLNIDPSGVMTFTPNSEFIGIGGFSYYLKDSTNKLSLAYVNIIIGPINRFPNAINDVYTTSKNLPTVVNPILNDSDPDGDPISITSIQNIALTPGTAQTINVTNGVLNIDPSGVMTFTPNSEFIGIGGFSYYLKDSTNKLSLAYVNIIIGPINRFPNAINDVYTTSKNLPTVVNPILNDSDPDGDPISITSIQNIALTPGTAQTINVTNGVLNIDPSGVMTFTPNSEFIGIGGFQYTINDATGRPSTTNSNVQVYGNRPPVAVNDTYSTHRTTSLDLDPLVNDSDPDSDQLTVTKIESTDLVLGSIQNIVVTNGTVASNWTEYGANSILIFKADLNFVGQSTFEYTVSDPNGATDIGQMNVTVTNTNPIAIPDITYTTPSNTSLELVPIPLSNDSDPDSDFIQLDTLNQVNLLPYDSNSVQSISTSNGNVLVYALSSTSTIGLIEYTPNANFVGTESFPYSISDGIGSGFSTIEVTVTNQNPTANPDTNISTNQGVGVNLTPEILSNDTDPESQTLSVDSINGQPFGSFSTTQTICTLQGSFVRDVSGNVRFVPYYGFSGIFDIPYTISDGQGGASSSTIQITVNPTGVPTNPESTGSCVEPPSSSSSSSSSSSTMSSSSSSSLMSSSFTSSLSSESSSSSLDSSSSSTLNSNSTLSSSSTSDSSSSLDSSISSSSSSVSIVSSSSSSTQTSSTTSTTSSSVLSSSSSSLLMSSSSNSSSSSSSSTTNYPITFSNGDRATLQIENTTGNQGNTCQSITQLTETNANGQKYIEFQAACNQVTIKTYWNNLPTNQSYTFKKINKNTNAEYLNFPAIITTETRNNQQVVVSTHTVTDNQAGDSNPAVTNILDPYTLIQTTNPPTIPSGSTGILGNIRSGTINILKLLTGGFGDSDGSSSNTSIKTTVATDNTNSTSSPAKNQNLQNLSNTTSDKNIQTDSNQKNIDGSLIRTGGFAIALAPIMTGLLFLCYLVIRRRKNLN